jgi:sugar lactone lactonase YvrE
VAVLPACVRLRPRRFASALGSFLCLLSLTSSPDFLLAGTTASKNLGTVGVGASATTTLDLMFSASVTVGSIKVVTQGVTGLDFQRSTASPGTCATGTTYGAGQMCTVNVVFAPKGIGQRLGAVLVYDNASTPNLVATTYIGGTGNGGMPSFSQSQNAVGTDLFYPYGVRVDGTGNIYIADTNNNRVVKVPAGGGAETTVATGFNYPWDVAIDGVGDVYVADYGNNRVVRVAPNGSQSLVGTGLSGPTGVAVAWAGNVYIADGRNARVVKVPASGGAQTSIGSGLYYPISVAVDTAGDVYIAEERGVVEVLPGGTQKAVGSGFAAPGGVAVDATGNVYVSDLGNSRLVEVFAGDGGEATIMTGLRFPNGVAVDGSGNVYICDSANSRVLQINRTQLPATVNFGAATVGGTPAAATLAFTNIGNVPLVFRTSTSSSRFAESDSCNGSVAINSSCTLNLSFTPTNGLPAPGILTAGTLTLTDNSVTPTQTVGLSGMAIALTAAKPLISPGTGTYTGAQMVSITDATPNATIYYTTDGTTPNRSSPIYSGPITISSSKTIKALAVATNYLTSPEGVASYTIKVPAGNPIISKNLGAVAIRGSVTASVTVSFNASVTLGSVKVVTQGVTGLDFQQANASPGTCSRGTAYAAGKTCTVNVVFTPQGVGQRMGAVLLYDNTATPNLIATAFLSGTGNGGLLGFQGIDEARTTIGTSWSYPIGMAVDAAGNVYIADEGNNRVVEVPANGGAQTTIGTGLFGPYGVALDGSGNVYIADEGNSRVVKVPANGGAQLTVGSGLSAPVGVAVDGSGNLYVADMGSHRVVEIPADGSPQRAIGTGLLAPWGVALDGAGNVYVADFNLGVIEIPVSGGSQKTLGDSELAPMGIAVDWAGNVFVADFNYGLVEIPSGSETWLPISAYQYTFYGVAIDGFGRIYGSDGPYGDVFESDRTHLPATVNFGATTVGGAPAAGQVGFSNIGNAPLTFQTKTSSGVFAATNSCGGVVGVNSPCTVNLTFRPTFGMPAPGTVTSGTLTLTDNSPSQTQAIGLTGMAIEPLTAEPVFSLLLGAYTGTQMVSVTDATPGATIYYTTDGTTPSRSSPVYSGPIAIKSSVTLKALAIATNYLTSALRAAAYTIK